MVPGLNTNVERNGAVFHVQTEDLGRSKPIIQTLVFYGGEVVTVVEYTYEDLATSDDFTEDEVRWTVSSQHRRSINEINAGVFDVVDPAVVARETEPELRQRERILDYLECALTYDREPCSTPETETGADPVSREESTVEEPAPPETAIEVTEESAAGLPASVEESAEVVAAPVSGRPSVDSRGTPVVDEPGPQRLVVIRRDRKGQNEHEDSAERHELETPQVIAVMQGDEVPQVVAVRQAVQVNVVTGGEPCVEEVLGQLDETLERTKPAPKPSRTGRPLVVAATVAALVLVVVGWRWFSGASSPTVETPAPQIVAETRPAPSVEPSPAASEPDRAAAPAPVRKPEPVPEREPSLEVAESRAAAPDEHGAAVPPVAAVEEIVEKPVEEPVEAGQEPLPPVVTGGGAEEAATEGGETAATLTPTVPEIPTGAPDPIETFEPEPAPDPAPVAAPAEPRAPAPKVRPGMLVELASVDKVPEPTVRAFPEYPKRARKKGRTGRVALSLLIDEKGNVAEIRVADGGAESDLSDAAIDAARGWKYTPARKGPYRVRVWKPVTVHFVLDGHNQSRVRVEE